MDTKAEREFRDFVSARSGALFATAYLLTGQREAAEDLLQTSLARTALKWDGLDHPEAYVRKAMYHQQVSWWRHRSWGREHSTADVPEGAEQRDPTAELDLRLSLAAALRLLAPRQRAVVVLRYFDDLPEREVADVLGVSVGTVRSQCHRALAKLRAVCPELTPHPNPVEGPR